MVTRSPFKWMDSAKKLNRRNSSKIAFTHKEQRLFFNGKVNFAEMKLKGNNH